MSVVTLQKWGNSQGFRIPKAILESLAWQENEKFSLLAQEDKIIIEPVQKRKSIQELFADFHGDYEAAEIEKDQSKATENGEMGEIGRAHV